MGPFVCLFDSRPALFCVADFFFLSFRAEWKWSFEKPYTDISIFQQSTFRFATEQSGTDSNKCGIEYRQQHTVA